MINNTDWQYLRLVEEVLFRGQVKTDRTGVGTQSISFPRTLSFDLQQSFPAITAKHLYFKVMAAELLWFISGSTNINDLPKYARKIWQPWAGEGGEIPRIYSKQWRSWERPESVGGGTVDQLGDLLTGITNNPNSRRHILCSWNPGELPFQALPACHAMAQFVVVNNHIHCGLTLRSSDIMCGLPFNIASYALLTRFIADFCSRGSNSFLPGKLHVNIGDAHLYHNHLEAAYRLVGDGSWVRGLARKDPNIQVQTPHGKTMFDLGVSDVKLLGYPTDAPRIKLALNV